MKLANAPKLVVTFVATLTIASACSKDSDSTSGGDGDGDMAGDGDGDGDMGDGDGDVPGDGDGDGDTGGSSMGGTSLGGSSMGGIGGGGAPEPHPREVCGTVDGMPGTVVCAIVPEACGDLDQYDGEHFFDSPGNDANPNTISNRVIFLFDGDDVAGANDNANCFVGGEGNDTFHLGSEGSATDSYIGGPGMDTFFFTAEFGLSKRIADFNPGEDNLEFETNEFVFDLPVGTADGAPLAYVAFVDDFDGTNAQIPQESTRIIYDPNSGHLWGDPDGNIGNDDPVHLGTFLNYESITISLSDFEDYSVD